MIRTFLTVVACLIAIGLFLIKDEKKVLQLPFKSSQEVKEWGAFEMPGKELKLQLFTRWRDGRLFYKFIVSPFRSFEGIFQKIRIDPEYRMLDQYFHIKFMDEYGFLIKQVRIRLGELTDVLDQSENRTKLMASSSIDCRRGDYAAMTYHNIAWALDSDLLPERQIASENE